jgi:hypothetical protein
MDRKSRLEMELFPHPQEFWRGQPVSAIHNDLRPNAWCFFQWATLQMRGMPVLGWSAIDVSPIIVGGKATGPGSCRIEVKPAAFAVLELDDLEERARWPFPLPQRLLQVGHIVAVTSIALVNHGCEVTGCGVRYDIFSTWRSCREVRTQLGKRLSAMRHTYVVLQHSGGKH